MRFSVLIVTHNHRELLLRCLAAATDLDYPDYEIIVVDDGSMDGSLEAAQRAFPEVRYVRHPTNKGEPAARNSAVQVARGEIVAFTDDDCLTPRDWLRRHAGYYDDPKIAAVGGPQICRAPDFFEQFDRVRYGVAFKTLQTITRIDGFQHLITGNMSVRREIVERLGGFDEHFRTGCDSDFIRRLSRAGYWFVRDPELRVDHLKTYRLASYLRMRFHRGCGSVLTDVKEGTLVPRRFVPIANPRAVLQHWREFRKTAGGGAGRCAGFCALAALTRCFDVAGRVHYYWTVGRRYHPPGAVAPDPPRP